MATPEEIDELRRAERFAGIRQYGDPVLRSETRIVERFDDGLRGQVEQMIEIMDRANGAGLAAPQVGVLHRLFVYRRDPDDEPRAVVNPVIEESGGERLSDLEGCLSIGRALINVEVERDEMVVVTAQDLDGEPLRIEADGLHARILQHEIDHLEGRLMLDRASTEQKREALRALREGVPWAPPRPQDDSGA